MSQRRVNETSLTATADALRAKLGTSDPITWAENQGFKEAVESIQTDSGGADVSGVTATETEVLENAIFVDAHGEYKEGTIPRNGDTSATFDGIETKSVEIPAGYTTGGTVVLDGTIDNAVEAAKTSLANKGVEVPTDTDVRGLAGLIDGISVSDGEPVYDATDVKFGSEPIDPDQLYKIGYNWIAEIVRILNEMTLQNNRLLLQEITGKVGGLGYIASRTAAQLEHTNIHTAWNINISSTATVVQEG